ANSTKEYSEQISAAANADVKVGLTGSFQASFKMNHTSEIKSNEVLITNQSKLCKQQEYIGGISEKELVAYTTSAFRDDAEDLTPKQFIKKYGTHILKNIDLGGRFELNYIYTNKSNKSTRDIEASVAAANAWASGDTSGSQDTQSKELSDNSKMYIRTYGGPVTVDTTSIEQARSSYPEWARGVQEGREITFIDCTENIPIWDIVKHLDFANAKEKAVLIEEYFDSRADEIDAAFKESVAVTTKAPTKIYFDSFYLGIGGKQYQAKDQLRAQGVLEANIIDRDLNDGAGKGSSYVYLGYKTTTDPAKAIRGLLADYYSKDNDDRHKEKIRHIRGIEYTKIPGDINADAGGKFVHLYYTKWSSAGSPITGIQWQLDGKFQRSNADNYEPILCRDGGAAMNFNYGNKGRDIKLWITRK
ncbi:MAG TPA: MAC/perforin domain-containing protein, partial [Bacillota bacterium]|nr:MAC/perforin domain-containing protein [Bacillota bacterium]